MLIRVEDEASGIGNCVKLRESIREKLGVNAGDFVAAQVELSDDAERAVVTLFKPKKYEGQIIEDPNTGLPVLTFGPDAPRLTNEDVREMLTDFP